MSVNENRHHIIFGAGQVGRALSAHLAGLGVAVNTTLSAIAPKVAGHLYDQGVGYAATFHFLAAWGFVSAVVLAFSRQPAAAMPGGAVPVRA